MTEINAPTEIDRIPVAELIQRYGKTKLYTQYFKDLHITPVRDGANSYISPEQNALIETYHAVKGRGKQAVAEFLNSLPGLSENVLDRSELQIHTDNAANLWQLIKLLTQLSNRLVALQEQQPDPLSPQRRLEEVSQNNWIVTSSQLRQIGVVPRAGERLGFRFSKVGRVGRENGWRVERSA